MPPSNEPVPSPSPGRSPDGAPPAWGDDRPGNLAPPEGVVGDDVAFRAYAGAVLGRSLDVEETLQQLAGLVVPRLADWATIDTVDGGELRLAAVAHTDPAKTGLVWRLRGRYGYPDRHGPGRVVRTGRPERLETVTDELLRSIAGDEAHLGVLRALRPVSAMAVPLLADDRCVGAMTLVQAESGRRYGEGDLAVVCDVAQQAATAVEHAARYGERDRTARRLQQALGPPRLPDPDGLDVAARYDPVDSCGVGSDFYDLIATPTGWLIVAGDVCDNRAGAAGLATLARHAAHAAALCHPDPSHVLGVVNDALATHEPTGCCSVVCAHLATEATPMPLRIASAGHPPGLIRRASGNVDQLDTGGRPLGLSATCQLTESQVTLGAGDVVVFYTHGVCQARRSGRRFGTEGIAATLRTAQPPTAHALVDHLHTAVDTWQDRRHDDRATLAIRIAP